MSENTSPINDTPQEKKGGKKFVVIAIVAVLLLGGAGGGFYFWRSSASAAEAESGKKKGSKKADKQPETAEEEPSETSSKSEGGGSDKALKTSIPNDEEVTGIVELPPFIVNLADTEQARYLRMTVSLGIEGEEGKSEKPDQLFITRVRNTILAVLSDKKSEDVLSVEGKAKLRKELLEAAKAASEEPKVKAIYITDFIVQL